MSNLALSQPSSLVRLNPGQAIAELAKLDGGIAAETVRFKRNQLQVVTNRANREAIKAERTGQEVVLEGLKLRQTQDAVWYETEMTGLKRAHYETKLEIKTYQVSKDQNKAKGLKESLLATGTPISISVGGQ
ncbi:MAG: hypothetical protein F6K63_29805 [Moorea sp. SIO1G6]|uniref:hypothetical protein n=1 Tax=Moorena sp. SIO1G6 TaxID=2607840 RepID=UPI0013C02526|nr:hypothetical protein [Moorena sp. SIO1G6]NET68365.1 hypothetical protein [Moorena sp. SIO1G6]